MTIHLTSRGSRRVLAGLGAAALATTLAGCGLSEEDSVGQAAAGQPRAQQADEERHRDERDRARRGPEQDLVARAADDQVDAEQRGPQQ